MSEAKAPNGLPYVDGFLEANGNVVQLKTLRPRHHAIMDFMLANPRIPYSAVAAEFNVTQAWLSTVINSDVFRAQLSARRSLMDEHVNRNIVTRLQTLAQKGLTEMEAILDDEEVSASTKLDVAKTSLTALGYLGTKGASPVQVNIQTNNQTTIASRSDILQAARARMQAQALERAASAHEPLTIEHKSD